MLKIITYKPFGNKAILVEWQSVISKDILNDILNFKSKILGKKAIFFADLIVGYNSLTIVYNKEVKNFEKEVKKLKAIYLSTLNIKKQANYIWEIPVCYDLEFGIDLDEISTRSMLSIKEIIRLHTEKIYTIFFIGFLPGFLYLGGLNKRLFFDRKSTPRINVAKGTVAIGGKQTGVYPQESAGGWNIIGRTPINFFNINKRNPCFAKAGDQIQFKAISKEEFYRIEKRVDTFKISKQILND